MDTRITARKPMPANYPARVILHPASTQACMCGVRPAITKVILPQEEGVRILNTAGILYCQAQSNYSNIILESGEQILIAKTLKWVEKLLPELSFTRPHSSYLVNLEHVTFIGRTHIQIRESIRLPLSRRLRRSILTAAQLYCRALPMMH